MSADGEFSLIHRMSLRDNEANRVALLKKLKDITGFEYTFEVAPAWVELIPLVHKAGVYARDHEKVGATFYAKDGYLHFIVEKFAEACKDDMVKEALLDSTTARKIVFTVRPTGTKAAKMAFTDGVFHVGVEADRLSQGTAKYICEGDITKFL